MNNQWMRWLVFFLSILSISPETPAQDLLYVGTYSERGSQGIYVLELDRATGQLTERQTLKDKASPTFLTVHPNQKYLYAVYREGQDAQDQQGTVTAFAINATDGTLSKINEQSSEGADPCHVSIDPEGAYAYVSNYSDGNLSVYPLDAKGQLAPASDVVQHSGQSVNPERQQGSHMHSAIPNEQGGLLYASDLGTDKIMMYHPERSSGKLSPAQPPFEESNPGAGPRHFALHPNGRWAFSIEELSSTIAVYRVEEETGNLRPAGRVPTLPEDVSVKNNTTADIHVSPDGQFVYASNRGHDSLVIYAVDPATDTLTYVGHEPTRGAHPRNFCIDSQGEFVFVANRDTDNVVVFRRDAASGKLTYTGHEAQVPAAVCVQQLRRP